MARVEMIGRNRDQYLPGLCIHCGEPCQGRVERTFAWYPPWRLILAVPGFIALLAVLIALQASSSQADSQLVEAILKRRSAKSMVPVCDRHRKARREWLLGLIAGCLALFGLGILALLAWIGNTPSLERLRAFLTHPIILIGITLATIAWLVAVVIGWWRSIRAVRIEGDDLILVNVDGRFAEAYDRERRRVAAILGQPQVGG